MNDRDKRDLMLRFAAENDGEWPYVGDGLIVSTEDNSCWGAGKYQNFLDGVNRFYEVMEDSRSWLWVCTRTEFEALMQELADNAPDGAECVAFKNGRVEYLAKYKNNLCRFVQNYVTDLKWTGNQCELIPLQKTEPKKWIPEVGQECEVQDVDKGWILGKAIAFDEDENVMVFKTKHGYSGYSDFRPLRTEAEKERDKLIEIIESCNMSSGVLADLIINAGWRPQETTK